MEWCRGPKIPGLCLQFSNGVAGQKGVKRRQVKELIDLTLRANGVPPCTGKSKSAPDGSKESLLPRTDKRRLDSNLDFYFANW